MTMVQEGVEAEVYGPYRLDEVLGRGGMGEVFRAFDTRRNRVVALKRMSRHLASDPEYRMRFQRESALTARLREPHIIPIHDYGEIDGSLYIDMRLVDGSSLAEMLRDGVLGVERAIDVVSQIADALDAAHAEGLVHRDVKPSNVLLVGGPQARDRGFAYLADFGVVATLGGSTLSRPGLAVGTAVYMAPERMAGGRWDHRIDVYSLACVLYECLTGRRAFAATDLLELLQAHLNSPPPRPSDLRRDLPAGIDEVIATGMAKDAGDRYPSAGALALAARALLAADAAAVPLAALEGPPVTEEAAMAEGDGEPDADPGPPGPDGPPAGSEHASTDRLATAGLAARRRFGGRAIRIVDVAAAGVVLAAVVVAALLVPLLLGPGPEAGSGWKVLTSVPVGLAPAEVALSPDGTRAYVTNQDSDTVSVVDTATRTVVGDPIPVGDEPNSVAVTPDGRRVYVTNNASDDVSVIDTARARVTDTIAVGDFPDGLAIAPGGRVVYVGNAFDDSVSVIDAATGTVPQPPIKVGDSPFGLAVSPDGTRLYVPAYEADTLAVVDTATRQVLTTIVVGDGPLNAALSRDGGRLFVTNQHDGTVSVIDTATNTVLGAPIPVGDAPTGITLSGDGDRMFVTVRDANRLIAVGVADGSTSGAITAGDGPVAIAVSPQGDRVYVVGQRSNDLTVLATTPG